MKRHLHRCILLISLTKSLAKDEELPLCPTNMQFFPQNLPMHCRMPINGDLTLPNLPRMPTMPPFPSYFQNQLLDKQPNPMPVPAPSFAGVPGPMPMVGPMPLPMMPGIPPHKLPVIVMPFYSPDPAFKKQDKNHKKKKKIFHKKKPRYGFDTRNDSDTDSDTDTDTSDSDTSDSSDSSSDKKRWSMHKKAKKKDSRRLMRNQKFRRYRQKTKKRKELLTPILQYVTKDGYVIFEKKISKNEAKDWLRTKNDAKNDALPDNRDKMDHAENEDQDDPKTDVEEIDLKGKEKSHEEKTDSSVPPQKRRIKKHRVIKPSNLMEQQVKPGSQM